MFVHNIRLSYFHFTGNRMALLLLNKSLLSGYELCRLKFAKDHAIDLILLLFIMPQMKQIKRIIFKHVTSQLVSQILKHKA
jgi:hypothetical protein